METTDLQPASTLSTREVFAMLTHERQSRQQENDALRQSIRQTRQLIEAVQERTAR